MYCQYPVLSGSLFFEVTYPTEVQQKNRHPLFHSDYVIHALAIPFFEGTSPTLSHRELPPLSYAGKLKWSNRATAVSPD